MKRWMMLPLLAALAVWACGCASVERMAPRQVKFRGVDETSEQILVMNYGYYLFGSIPLFTGDLEDGGVAFFRDDATLDKVQSHVAQIANEKGAVLFEVQPMLKTTCNFAAIPVLGTTFGLLWYKEVQVSAHMAVTPKAVDVSALYDELGAEEAERRAAEEGDGVAADVSGDAE